MKLPQRKSPRLRDYDYSSARTYFVTICTNGKTKLFGTVETLNTYGCIAETELLALEQNFQGVRVDRYVVMPNHIHALIRIEGDNQNQSLSSVVGSYKSAVSRKIHTISPNVSVWQKSYYDHVIRTEESYLNIWKYIDENPIRWENDEYYL
ncbi:MAG: transposase [Clostridia bacterium]|nr:transposase [Clostridia bacterium]